MSDISQEDGHSPLRIGDVVLNAWASPGINDLHIVTGHTMRKSGPYSSTKYYKTRCLLDGRLATTESLFAKTSHNLRKIGHIDYESYIKTEMLSILESQKEKTNE